MTRNLQHLRVILTGASSGIGQALARLLAGAGAKVALAARSVDKLSTLQRDLATAGHSVLAVPTDVTSPADRQNLLDTVVQQWGGLDLLINNAGVGAWGHFATSTEAINRQVLEVNFFAAAELIRLAVPHLMRGVTPAVCNVTSMCARRGIPAWPEYSASKFALMGLTEALRAELARFDVDVITIVPGLTASDLNRHLLRNEGRADIRYDKGMTPEYVATRIVDAIRRNRREVVLGWEAKLILTLNRFAPRFVNWRSAKTVQKLYAKPTR
jgi:short-subunit dehydrogenase